MRRGAGLLQRGLPIGEPRSATGISTTSRPRAILKPGPWSSPVCSASGEALGLRPAPCRARVRLRLNDDGRSHTVDTPRVEDWAAFLENARRKNISPARGHRRGGFTRWACEARGTTPSI